MYHYGFRGISQKWIQSYLSQRKQFVEYDEVTSSCKGIVYGIFYILMIFVMFPHY